MASELKAVFTAKKMAIVERDGERFEALIRLQAPDDGAQVRMPLSLTAVIDRSRSMHGGRIEAAKACTIDLIKRLRDDDEVGVVIYDHEISVLLPLRFCAMSSQVAPSSLLYCTAKVSGSPSGSLPVQLTETSG